MSSPALGSYPHTNSDPIHILAYWVRERNLITKLKDAGKTPPYTDDPILRSYRFCSVHREDDRVTRWIARHWRSKSDGYTWHAMIVARFLNWTPTLEYCGYPEPWGTDRFATKLLQLEREKQRIFTSAYIVSTNGGAGSKVSHVLGMFDRAWEELGPVLNPPRRRIPGFACMDMYSLLRTVNGIGKFMAAQVVADLKYTGLLDKAPDWMDFVAPGPGSMRGLNRMLGRPIDSSWNDQDFREALIELRKRAGKLHKPILGLHLQDLQNCLCESDKYMRKLYDEGKPRAYYRANPEPMP